MKIGFLGCGKIGKTLLNHIKENEYGEVVFIEDPYTNISEEVVIRQVSSLMYEKANLIIECATAGVLKEHLEVILKNADLLMFSITAFSDFEFAQQADILCKKYNRKIYIPHGAILGLDGIFDGRYIWSNILIETIKNPKSLGREDNERIIIYDGPTREACKLYPRNVNVHAAIALAGIGFDKTCSQIISDPQVDTNEHKIHLKGEGIDITINISSFAGGAVTGAYTPHSACGSVDRICKNTYGKLFV